jgi:hypothetical protein
MQELLRTNDLVHISWARAVLDAAGIENVLLDDHVSGIEGSIGAIPRRLVVPDDRYGAAQAALADARRDLPGSE